MSWIPPGYAGFARVTNATVENGRGDTAGVPIELARLQGIPSWRIGRMNDHDGMGWVVGIGSTTSDGFGLGDDVPLGRGMADPKKKKDGEIRRAGKEPSPLDKGFDRWLNRQLHGFYDPVLNEAVPDDIAKLLDQFESKDKKSGPEGQGEG
jgi:hypothetical protein